MKERSTMSPEEFRDTLKEVGLSQAEFARRAQCAESAIFYWLTGKNPIPGWVPWVLSLLLPAAKDARRKELEAKRQELDNELAALE